MAEMNEVSLGDIARDTITGFNGVVVALTYWLNGCNRVTLQPQKLRNGMPLDMQTFDVQQIVVMKRPPKFAEKPSGGPMPEPVRR